MYDVNFEDVINIYGITCFEYCYCLALKFNNQDIEPLYFQSFFSLDCILREMINNKQNYLTYDDVGRIHHLGNGMNYLKFTCEEGDYTKLEAVYNNQSNIFHIIIKLEEYKSGPGKENKMPYFEGVNNRLALLLSLTNNEVRYYDPMLKREIIMSKGEFQNCYDNVMYLLERKSIDNNNLRYICDRSLILFYEHLGCILCDSNQMDYDKLIDESYKDEILLSTIRDAVGIVKVLTNRALEYINYMDSYSNKINAPVLRELLNRRLIQLNRLYVLIEYLRKKNMKLSEFPLLFQDIIEIDSKIRIILKSVYETCSSVMIGEQE